MVRSLCWYTERNRAFYMRVGSIKFGASLDAKVLLYVPDVELCQQLQALNPTDSLNDGNHVDELRYLLLASQVELLDSPDALNGLKYSFQSDASGVGVVKADGEKCDR